MLKIAFIDIENCPNLAYVWDKYEQNVLAYEQEWYMLTFAVKWRGEAKTQVFGLPDFPDTYAKDPTDDSALVTRLHRVFDEADIIVGHNSDKFDIRKSNTRMLAAELMPPSPYKTRDTLKIARKHFKFNSNKLSDLAEFLGEGRKIKTGGVDLWLGCMTGNPVAWSKMKRYNRRDVIITERIYDKLLGWDNTHPNINVNDLAEKAPRAPRMDCDGLKCPNCASPNIQKRGVDYRVAYQIARFQCKDCGRWSNGERTKIPGRLLH